MPAHALPRALARVQRPTRQALTVPTFARPTPPHPGADSSFGSSTGAPTQVAIEVRPDAKPAAGTAVPVHVGALDLESAGTANRVDA